MSLAFIGQTLLIVYIVGAVTIYSITLGMCLLIGFPPKGKRLWNFVGPAIWPIALIFLIIKDVREQRKNPRPRHYGLYHGLRYKNWQW